MTGLQSSASPIKGGGYEGEATASPPFVVIVLSVYNGADHLAAQLESFRRQSHRSWALYWRDDGSNDGSCDIVRNFAAQCAPGQCVEVFGEDGQLGIGRAYERLMRSAPEGVFIAFADQDDVWLEDKLARAVSGLGQAERAGLYCGRQYIVDEHLENRKLSHILPDGHHLKLGNALTQNLAVGHTIMLNPAAIRLILRFPFPDRILHDWWSYLVVAMYGGKIVTDNQPCSLYRQHRRNVVGASASMFRRGYRALKRGPAVFMSRFINNVEALQDIALQTKADTSSSSEMVSEKNRALLNSVASALQTGPMSRLIFLMRHRELSRQGLLEQLVFCLWFTCARAHTPENDI